MAHDQWIVKGATSNLIEVMVRDSTTGAGKTGLAYGSVTYAYMREGAASATHGTCATMSLGTWATTGWAEVDATYAPGLYQFGIPDAAVATGTNAVTLFFTASGALPTRVRVMLVNCDVRDSTRLGLAALPNAAANGSNGLPTIGTGAVQINPASGKVPATLDSADVTGNVAADLQTIKAKGVTAGSSVTFPATIAAPGNQMDLVNAPNATGVLAIAMESANSVWTWVITNRTLTGYSTMASDIATAVWSAVSRTLTAVSDSSGVTTLLSRILGTLDTGTHKPQSGDAYARLGAPAGASVSADVAAVKLDTSDVRAVSIGKLVKLTPVGGVQDYEFYDRNGSTLLLTGKLKLDGSGRNAPA